ncbi:MAG: hypothetical protein WCF33_00725 [Pseudonocardiaceae bacterium]
MAERIWTGLDVLAADGLACVICGRGLLSGRSRVRLPVGRSDTGSQVFACIGDCAAMAETMPEMLTLPEQALSVAGMTFLMVLDRVGGDPRHVWHGVLVAATVRAATPLVQAAELRHIATDPTTSDRWARSLRARAIELDPSGGER